MTGTVDRQARTVVVAGVNDEVTGREQLEHRVHVQAPTDGLHLHRRIEGMQGFARGIGLRPVHVTGPIQDLPGQVAFGDRVEVTYGQSAYTTGNEVL